MDSRANTKVPSVIDEGNADGRSVSDKDAGNAAIVGRWAACR